jgi:hypothetical protein
MKIMKYELPSAMLATLPPHCVYKDRIAQHVTDAMTLRVIRPLARHCFVKSQAQTQSD